MVDDLAVGVARRARRDRRLDPVRRAAGRRSPTGSTRSREPLVEATGTQEAVASILAVALGLAGIARRLVDLLGAASSPAPTAVGRSCSSTSSTSTSSTTSLFYRPAVGLAHGPLRAASSGPLVGGSIAGRRPARARWRGRASASCRPASSAPTRSRSPRASPSSSSSSSRCADGSGWLTTALILLPLAAALVVWLLPLPPRRGRLDRRCSSRSPRSASGSTALVRLRLRPQRACSSSQRQTWFSDLGVSYHVGFYGFSLWLVGLTVVVLAAAIAYAVLGRPRAAARLLRADAASSPARSSASSPPRTCCSSTSSGRRC